MCVCLYVYKHLPCILHAGLTACVSHFERQGITHASEARLRPLVRGGRAGRGRGDVLGRGGGGGGHLKVACAPKWFSCEFPLIKTTKLLVETRSGIWAKRICPSWFFYSCRAPLILRVTIPLVRRGLDWVSPKRCAWGGRRGRRAFKRGFTAIPVEMFATWENPVKSSKPGRAQLGVRPVSAGVARFDRGLLIGVFLIGFTLYGLFNTWGKGTFREGRGGDVLEGGEGEAGI